MIGQNITDNSNARPKMGQRRIAERIVLRCDAVCCRGRLVLFVSSPAQLSVCLKMRNKYIGQNRYFGRKKKKK